VKIDWSYPRQVALVLLSAALMLFYPLLTMATQEVVLAVLLGALLSTVNTLLGFLAIEYSFSRSYTTFMKAVLGGMVARMLLTLAVMLVLILVWAVHGVALTVSMFGFYCAYLVLEVIYIQKKVLVRNREE
jgi:hypothetical protein